MRLTRILYDGMRRSLVRFGVWALTLTVLSFLTLDIEVFAMQSFPFPFWTSYGYLDLSLIAAVKSCDYLSLDMFNLC